MLPGPFHRRATLPLEPTGTLIPDEVVRHWQRELPSLRADRVDDVNHDTLVIGARSAAEVARAVRHG
jgi:hypothetical protein